jgi:hypothetical protein
MPLWRQVTRCCPVPMAVSMAVSGLLRPGTGSQSLIMGIGKAGDSSETASYLARSLRA